MVAVGIRAAVVLPFLPLFPASALDPVVTHTEPSPGPRPFRDLEMTPGSVKHGLAACYRPGLLKPLAGKADHGTGSKLTSCFRGMEPLFLGRWCVPLTPPLPCSPTFPELMAKFPSL